MSQTNTPSEAIILCEGYYDRAFWNGWLTTRLGCTDPGITPGKKERVPIPDPWGSVVKGGQFAYRSVSGEFIRIIPCTGKDNVLPLTIERLKQRVARRISRLVINVDSDQNADGTPSVAVAVSRENIEQTLRGLDPALIVADDGSFLLDNGITQVCTIRWEANDAVTDCLPNQQTLERLACASIVAAYPERGQCVQNWLAACSDLPESSAKTFAWMYMAGWHAENGSDDFYADLWRDKTIAAELENRLRKSGAWEVIAALAS